MTTAPQEHRFYRQAYGAYTNWSHIPEDRAKSSNAYYDEICAEFTAAGKESAIEKFTKLYLSSLAAKSRCASWAITGPARFNIARNEKRMRWEQKHTQAMFDFVDKVRRPPPEPRHELDYNIEAKEYQIGNVTVKHNTDENRLQLLFPGKPEADMIAKLKSRGFKWSPRWKAWQRQLTPNALRVVPYILQTEAA